MIFFSNLRWCRSSGEATVSYWNLFAKTLSYSTVCWFPHSAKMNKYAAVVVNVFAGEIQADGGGTGIVPASNNHREHGGSPWDGTLVV